MLALVAEYSGDMREGWQGQSMVIVMVWCGVDRILKITLNILLR